jgi:hypothetical protein
LCLGIPLAHVTIDPPHLHRGRYQPAHDAGLECLATMCLSGPAAEVLCCGAIGDGGDEADYRMARRHLGRRFGPLQIGTELTRLRDAADKLVRLEQRRVERIATALLERSTLNAAQIDDVLWRTA